MSDYDFKRTMDLIGYENEFIQIGKKPTRLWYTLLFDENDLRTALYNLEKRKLKIGIKQVDIDELLEAYTNSIQVLDHESWIYSGQEHSNRIRHLEIMLLETHQHEINNPSWYRVDRMIASQQLRERYGGDSIE